MISLSILGLKTLDIFGKEAQFNLNGKKKSKSAIGGTASIAFYAFVLWAIYHIGNDMIVREQPKTITSESFSENPAAMMISPNTFTFAFGLEHPDSFAHYINDSIYTVAATHHQLVREMDEKGQVSMKWTTTPLEIETCTQDHFGSLGSKFANLELNQLFCLKKEQPSLGQIRIQGVFESPIYEYVEVDVKECNSSASNTKCAPQADRDKLLGGGWFAIYYPNLAIDPKNYSYPNIQYRDSYFTTIGNTYFKEVTINLNHVEISTDSGWLLDDVEVNKYISFDYVRENTNFRPDLENIASLVIRVSKITSYYDRSYRKVQDIMADVDGLITLVLVLAAFIIGPYSDLKFYETLINELFDVRLLNKIKSTKINPIMSEKHALSNTNHFQTRTDQINISIENLKRNENSDAITKPRDSNIGEISQVPLKGDSSAMDLSATTNRVLLNTNRPEAINPPNTPIGSNDFQKIRQIFPLAEIAGFQAFEMTFEGKAGMSSDSKSEEKIRRPHSTLSSPKKTEKIDVKQNNIISVPPEIPQKYSINNYFLSKQNTLGLCQTRTLDGYEFKTMSEEVHTTSNCFGHQKEVSENQANNNLEMEITEKLQYEKPPDSPLKMDKYTEIETKKEDNISNQPEEFNQELVLETAKELPIKLCKTHDRIEISFWEYVQSFVWKTKALKEKMSILEEGSRRINERLDIFKVFKKFREIDKLKLLLLENEQFVLFDSLPQPELSCPEHQSYFRRSKTFAHNQLKEAKFIEEKIKKDLIIHSYSNLKLKPRKTMIDVKILEIYDDILAH